MNLSPITQHPDPQMGKAMSPPSTPPLQAVTPPLPAT